VASIRPGRRGAREPFWPRRLRWRFLGAWRWPAFVAFTAIDGVILNELPPIGTDVDLGFGLIMAAFGNLALLSIVDLLGRFWERKQAELGRHGPPTAVVMDRVAGGLLLLGAVGLLAAGLGNRPVIVSETEATEEAARRVREYVLTRAPAEYGRNLETANTIRLADGYFRTCIARDDRRRHYCLFVDTSERPTQITPDPSAEPNSAYNAR
jgi:hypothetical protein